MAPAPTPTDVGALLTTLLEMEEIVGAAAHDERGNVIASVGGLGSHDVLILDVPLRLGGRLVVYFRERSVYGIVRMAARRIEGRLTELVVAHERSLVRPPRMPGSA